MSNNNSGENLVISIVDNDRTDRELLRLVLRKMHIHARIHEYEHGEGLLEAVNGKYLKNPPDLIILDLNLQRVSGFHVLEFFENNELPFRIPIIVFAASDADEDRKKAISLGAYSYIQKPSSLDNYNILIDAIRECIIDKK